MTIPVVTTPLIGRAGELDRIEALVARERLVTIVGPGGVGKTRLATEAAVDLETEFNRVAFVDLSLLDGQADTSAGSISATAERITGLMAVALGVNAPDRGEGWRHLDVEPTLVVVDNCEHVRASAAAVVAEVLTSSRQTRIIGTSRSPLAVSGESVVDLPPLPVTVPAAGQQATENPAVELFVARAEAARADLVFDTDTRSRIAALCQRLDGLPLAIEIVAARARSVPIEDLLALAGDAIAALADRRHDVDDRHRSLASSVAWSRSFLRGDEDRALVSLAAIDADLSLDAVCAVVGRARHEALDLVDTLVDSSLVTYTASAGRYGMLDHVRRACTVDHPSAETEDDRRRWVDWCISRAVELGGGVEEPEVVSPALLAEAESFRAATRWCVSAGDHQRLVGLVGPLATTWVHLGWPVDTDGWRRAADAQLDEQLDLALTVLVALGYQLGWIGRIEDAAHTLDRVVQLAQANDRRAAQANALVQRSNLELHHSPTSADIAGWLEQAIALYDALPSVWGRAWSRYALGRYLEHGTTSPASADRYYQEALTLVAGADYPVIEGLIAERRARSLLRSADPKAIDHARRSRTLHRRAAYPEGEATAANVEGAIHLVAGRLQAAAACHRHALRIAIELRHEGISRSAIAGLATVAIQRSLPRLAARLIGAAATTPDDPAALAQVEASLPPPIDRYLTTACDDPALAPDRRAGAEADAVDVLSWDIVASDSSDDHGGSPSPTVELIAPLTERERTVLGMLRSDLTQRQIATELIVAPSTIKTHVKAIYRKLGATNRAEALATARQLGI